MARGPHAFVRPSKIIWNSILIFKVPVHFAYYQILLEGSEEKHEETNISHTVYDTEMQNNMMNNF